MSSSTVAVPSGGYAYLPGVFQYSYGVRALPGFEIVRARFVRPVTLAEGFARIRRHLEAAGRPLAALCAGELRSPGQMDEAGFRAFNRRYVSVLGDWGLVRDDVNPVARCNLAAVVDPPVEPSFYAFSYTVPAGPEAAATFVTGGAADCPEGRANYRDHIVRPGDTSIDGMREKLRFALSDLEARFDAMGVGWNDVTDTHLYTVHDIHPLVADEFARRGAMPGGLCWHYVNPPVEGLALEIDALAVARHLVLQAGA